MPTKKKRKNPSEPRGGYRPGSGKKKTGNAKKQTTVGIRPAPYAAIVEQYGTVQRWVDAITATL